jgi:hypothetical protein
LPGLDYKGFAQPDADVLANLLRAVVHDSEESADEYDIAQVVELEPLLQTCRTDESLPDTWQPVCDGNKVVMSKAKLKGWKGRQDVKKFSPEYVVSVIADRLRYHAEMRGWSNL